MKRTPLKRKTPLRAKAPMKRKPMKPYRRKPEDRTDPTERAHVLAREGECIARILTRVGWTTADECATEGGQRLPVKPVPPEYLTAEHVLEQARMGMRANAAKSAEARRGDPQRRWMVAACWHHNVNGWCSKNRSYIRAYLEFLVRQGAI